MKKVVVLLFLLLLSFTFVCAQSETVEGYAEVVGEGLLKVQGALMGALSFFSFGAFSEGGTFAFAQFLFIILFFMLVYSILTFMPFINTKVQFPMALIISILGFLYVDAGTIEMLLTNYEAMGIAMTLILPILIVFAFTFRMYQKAYEGESEKSPFYVKLFNMVFLVFFGVFFIRYSFSEEGVIAVARFWSGYALIGIGVAQFLFLYRVFSIVIGKMKKDYAKEKRKEKAAEKAEAEELDEIKVKAAEELAEKNNSSDSDDNPLEAKSFGD